MWWGAMNQWLCDKANAHFSKWTETNEGKKWAKNRNKSPYHFGYHQPEWMKELREALGHNDEATAKAIKLNNL